ncbi:uncharacterized protein LOC116170768 [Photinus pyralis]|uniref:uncharacterized protein LOC116170768 n=1 Tax=Photinus pyralis TaxID=7054 RepID=UPI001267528A|nr:uncharacterized protein LOC116170768 [Photinus pyralis]
MTGKRRIPELVVEVKGQRLATEARIKILGVWIDKNLSFIPHVEEVCGKATRSMVALGKIMSNIGGARASKRKVMASAAISILGYAVEVWQPALRWGTARTRLDRVLRLAAIRVASAYRTVPTQDIMVVAGIPPAEVLFNGRANGWSEARRTEEWQSRWLTRVSWTKTLIPDLTEWKDRSHGEVDYHLTQLLTGHGENGVFLAKIGKRVDERCRDCGQRDHQGHAAFECQRWAAERAVMETEVGVRLGPHNLISTMLRDEASWGAIARYWRVVCSARERDSWSRT